MEQQTTIETAREQQPILAPLRYCLYARKSTERDEALSIDSQIKEIKKMFDLRNRTPKSSKNA